jgi:hypothetical protein
MRKITMPMVISCLVCLAFLTSQAEAAPVSFAGYQWEANGDAALSGATLRLTPYQANQEGSAFIATPYSLTSNTSFSAFFQFKIHGLDNNHADGFTFIVQNDEDGESALGQDGYRLGYGEGTAAISPSIAVEFDTLSHSWDPPDPTRLGHVAIDRDGAVQLSLASALAPSYGLAGADRYAWIDYDGCGNMLDVFLSDTATKPGSALLSYTFTDDLDTIVGSEAFFGFSAGTGGWADYHDVIDFSLSGPSPVPEPSILLLLGAGLVGLAGFSRKSGS